MQPGSSEETWFIAVYVLIFAALLFTFEVQTMKPCPAIQRQLRANFGFLYRPFSKAAFLIFVAFLEFGLDTGEDNAWGIVCGVFLIAYGTLYGLCAISRPHYIAEPMKDSTYTPPEPPAFGGTANQDAQWGQNV